MAKHTSGKFSLAYKQVNDLLNDELDEKRGPAGTFIKKRLYRSPAFLSLGVRGSIKGGKVSSTSIHILFALLQKRNFDKKKKTVDDDGYTVPRQLPPFQFTLSYK